MVDVLLADNQALTAAGLIHFLEGREDFKIAGHVQDKEQFAPMLEKHQPTLVIADYNLSGYLTIQDLKMVKELSPASNILIVSSDSNKPAILEVLQLGVKGYLTKECSREEIIMAMQSTARGDKFYCNKILDVIMEQHFAPESENSDPAILTGREREILKLLSLGYSTQKIADELYLSPHTVHSHRKSIIRKLSIKSPTEFVIYAIDFGLIKPK